jgi:multiple sugar transport system substrate-binding protein
MSDPEPSPSPSSGAAAAETPLSRRSVLKGVAGALGLAVVPGGLLAACGGGSGTTSGSTKAATTPSTGGAAASSSAPKSGGSITAGSLYSDPSVKGAFAALTAEATATTNVQVQVNTTAHETFKSNISNYLQGTPDDLATWFAGFRMQFFAAQGLFAPIDDVWDKIGINYTDAGKALSKGLDGHYYMIPLYNYPWVVYYNKSVFAAKGYTVPKTWDDFLALAKKMKQDGLIPLAFADQDLWPAAGTFDILNLRINGYDFHMQLMRHEVPYTDPKVTAVFEKFAELLPYMQTGANGRIWQDAAKALENKQAGMMFQGANQVAANYSDANRADLDFFVYPEINPTFGQYYMDAPADGISLTKKAKNPDAAKRVLEYIGTGPAALAYLKTDQWDVALIKDLEVPSYNELQKKSAVTIGACKNVSQFLDRDTDPAMASAFMALLQKFIDDPSASNIKSIQASAEAQAKPIFS